MIRHPRIQGPLLLVSLLALLLFADTSAATQERADRLRAAPDRSLASVDIASATAPKSDASRLRIALDVLEETAKSKQSEYAKDGNCDYLRQEKDIVEASVLLARTDERAYGTLIAEKNHRLTTVKQNIETCDQKGRPARTPAAANVAKIVVIVGSPSGTGAGGGCTSLIAGLLTLDEPARREYAASTALDVNLDIISGADYIVFDVANGGLPHGLQQGYETVQAKCPDGPGVEGMSRVILSYFQMTDRQRNAWMQEVPPAITDYPPKLPLPTAIPFPGLSRTPFAPNSLTPAIPKDPWRIFLPTTTVFPH